MSTALIDSDLPDHPESPEDVQTLEEHYLDALAVEETRRNIRTLRWWSGVALVVTCVLMIAVGIMAVTISSQRSEISATNSDLSGAKISQKESADRVRNLQSVQQQLQTVTAERDRIKRQADAATSRADNQKQAYDKLVSDNARLVKAVYDLKQANEDFAKDEKKKAQQIKDLEAQLKAKNGSTSSDDSGDSGSGSTTSTTPSTSGIPLPN